MSDLLLEQIKRLIEQLEPAEVDRLRAWLNTPLVNASQNDPRELTWGEQLVRLVSEFPRTDADEIKIDDPEAWVREHRCKKTRQQNPGWGDE
jgi:hypothetical protein